MSPDLETTPPHVTSYLSGSDTSPGVLLPLPMVPLNQPSSSPPSRAVSWKLPTQRESRMAFERTTLDARANRFLVAPK